MSDAPASGTSDPRLDEASDPTIADARDPRIGEILDIVAKETGVDRMRLVPEAVITDLEIASLDLVQTIFAIEERYKVDIPVVAEQTGAEFTTVGDLVQHVIATLDKALAEKVALSPSVAPGTGQGA